MQNTYLAHHGVKGMKWGVRHDPKPGVKSLNAYNETVVTLSNGKKARVAQKSKVGRLQYDQKTGKLTGRGSGTSTFGVAANQGHQAYLHSTEKRMSDVMTNLTGFAVANLSTSVTKLQKARRNNLYSDWLGEKYTNAIISDAAYLGSMAMANAPIAAGALALGYAGYNVGKYAYSQYKASHKNSKKK